MDATKWRKTEFLCFDTVEAFCNTCIRETKDEYKNASAHRDWDNGHNWHTAIDCTLKGNTDAVPRSEKLLDKIDRSLDLTGLRPVWQTSPVGAFPNVPAFLANAPETMYRKEATPVNNGEINIFFTNVCSLSVDAETMYNRGIGVLAMASALSRARPVNLYFYSCYGKHDHIVKLKSPMVISEAAYVTSHPAFYRRLSYGLSESHGWGGGWASWINASKPELAISQVRKRLKLTETDVILPPVYKNQADALCADPVAAINEQLERYRS